MELDDRQTFGTDIIFEEAKKSLKKKKYRYSYRILQKSRSQIAQRSLSFKIKFLRLYLKAFLKMTMTSLLKRESLELHSFEEQAIDCLEALHENSLLLERYTDVLKGRVLRNRFDQHLEDEDGFEGINLVFQLDNLYSSYIECLVCLGLVLRRNEQLSSTAMTFFRAAERLSGSLINVTTNYKLMGKCVLPLLHMSAIHIENGEHEESMTLLNRGLDLGLKELILLKKRKVAVMDPESKRMKYELGKCCHVLLVLLLQMMYNCELQKKLHRLFEVSTLASWLIENHMPKDDLSKNFNKAISELTTKYEQILRVEQELSDLSNRYFESHVAMLIKREQATQRKDCVDGLSVEIFNSLAFDQFQYHNWNIGAQIGIEQPDGELADDLKHKNYTAVSEISINDIIKLKQSQKSLLNNISLDDIVPDEAFNIAFEGSPEKLDSSVKKGHVYFDRKSLKKTTEVYQLPFQPQRQPPIERNKRRSSQITDLQKKNRRLSEQQVSERTTHSERQWRLLREANFDEVVLMRSRAQIRKRAVLSQPHHQRHFNFSRQSKSTFKTQADQQFKRISDIGRNVGRKEPPKKQVSDSSEQLVRLSRKGNSQKLRIILFKRKDYLGLDKLFNHRKRLENDRIKNYKNFLKLKQLLNYRPQAEQLEWQNNLEKTLNRINSQVLEKIRNESSVLASEYNNLKKKFKKTKP